MKVTYLRLENVAGIYVGSNRHELEINFNDSKNNIISIIGSNGTGKTVLLSSISPFANVTSLDERSTLSYIIPKKNGYKEIHYINGEDEYVIKHYYKATKDSHSVKSYFKKNGEELNENGNVTSFISLINIHFGLTQEMMRLVRLGTNVSSFINLTSARRKEYVGKLIEELDLYMKMYKKINDDIRVVKVMLSSNNTNLYNCHISDIIVEETKLEKLQKSIGDREHERDQLLGKIGKIRSLIAENNIDELRRKCQDAEMSLAEFSKIEDLIKSAKLENTSVDKLIVLRSTITEKKINIQAKISSYRISIDNTLRNIERLEVAIKKITSNNDMQSLIDAISSLKESIQSTNKLVVEFVPLGSTSHEIYQMIAKLNSFNQISQLIHTFGSKPINVYLRLKRSKKSIDKFLKEQSKHNLSRINKNDISSILNNIFQDDVIITPNCNTQYVDCPYYRIADTMDSIRDKLEEDEYDDDTLRYIKVISDNVDNILNELDMMKHIMIPDSAREGLNEKHILERLESGLPFFDLSILQEFLSILKEYEIYRDNISKLKEYEKQLVLYKSSGIDSHISEIKELKGNIEFYKNNINVLEKDVLIINKELESVDSNIALVTKYEDGKKYRKMFETNLASTKKILEPLESAAGEKMELEFSLRQVTNLINIMREDHKALESRINEYRRLTQEGEKLSLKLADLSIILDTLSTKKGLPVVYMNRYLGEIQSLANNLLKIIYGNNFHLSKFNVTSDVFEIPYIKNGNKISDARYASQSEVALITMALSFALASKASQNYNILLLDEIDAGLDEENRTAFLKMLYAQMRKLKAEQCFIISHNLSQMVNIPMDCIMLSDTGTRSKLQTIIYE